MAMPSGNVVISEKMQFPGGGGGNGVAAGGGEVMHHPLGWFPDERDGFISWLRGEFAAANAIIDSLCHHLKLISDPGEYDGVIGCIQQRRCNWTPVLHMQQYFPVADVIFALQQVTWRRQQRFLEPVKVPATGKDFRRPGGGGGRQGQQRGGMVREGHVQNLSVESHDTDGNSNLNQKANGLEKGERVSENVAVVKPDAKGIGAKEQEIDIADNTEVDRSLKGSGSAVELTDDGCPSKGAGDVHKENDFHAGKITNEKQNLSIAPQTFVGNEIIDGMGVNVVEGMKLYEKMFDDSEVSKLTALVNDLRAAGRKGHLQGQTFIVSKRPMKGHGREMIQFGIPIADTPPEDEVAAATLRDRKIEPIPGLLHGVINHLIASRVVAIKPDSCVIDIFNEGDHSQPRMWPHWYGRPVCVLFLTECDMAFGKVIVVEHHADYRGSLNLSFSPGSLLVMQGKSADFARHAIPSIRKQRILITLTKSQSKRTAANDQRFLSAAVAPASHWVPPPSRSPNHARHPAGSKHYGPVPPSGVLPGPPARPQLPPPNGIQPIFVPAPVAPAIPFPAPVALPPASTGWSAAPLRHPAPRLPAPGTGVFLPPPGSGNSSAQAENLSAETPTMPEKDNGVGKLNGNSSASPKGKVDGEMQKQEYNGSLDEPNDGNTDTKAEHQNVDMKVASKAAGGI